MTDRDDCNTVRLVPLRPQFELALVDSLRELSQSAFSDFGSYRETIDHWLTSEHAVTLCAVEDTQPVGFITYVYRRVRDQVSGEIIALAVASSARRRGIGQRLFEQAIKALKSGAVAVGATSIELNVSHKNESAQRLFFKHGFSLVGASGRYPNGDRANRMTLHLDSESLPSVNSQ